MTVQLANREIQDAPSSAAEIAAVSLLPRAVLSAAWREQLEALTALSIRWYEVSGDPAEQAAIDLEISAARDRIQSTEAALERLARHTYGRCETCSGPIDPLRLTALPAATGCRRCERASAAESG
jgi:RNA polymerase-binding transcription factor DksA